MRERLIHFPRSGASATPRARHQSKLSIIPENNKQNPREAISRHLYNSPAESRSAPLLTLAFNPKEIRRPVALMSERAYLKKSALKGLFGAYAVAEV